MFLKFFPDEQQHADGFVAELQSHDVEISMAILQSYFMLYRTSAAEARANAAELCLGLKEAIPVQQHMAQQQTKEHTVGAVPSVTHTGAVPSLRTAADTGATGLPEDGGKKPPPEGQ